MQIYIHPVKNLFFEGNPHFYLDFYPQCLALGFQSIFVDLNPVEEAIVGDLKCFPSSSTQTKSVQIQTCTSSRLPVLWKFSALNERFCTTGNSPGNDKQKRQRGSSTTVSL